MREFHYLRNLVIAEKAFQYSLSRGQDFLCGIPVQSSEDVLHVLVAFGQMPHRSFSHKAGNGAKAYHPAEMKSFLSDLKVVIEESLTAKREAEEVAQQLDIPIWDTEVCIQCNKCVMVCPHAAIRAKVYEPQHLQGAPETFQAADFRSSIPIPRPAHLFHL